MPKRKKKDPYKILEDSIPMMREFIRQQNKEEVSKEEEEYLALLVDKFSSKEW